MMMIHLRRWRIARYSANVVGRSLDASPTELTRQPSASQLPTDSCPRATGRSLNSSVAAFIPTEVRFSPVHRYRKDRHIRGRGKHDVEAAQVVRSRLGGGIVLAKPPRGSRPELCGWPFRASVRSQA